MTAINKGLLRLREKRRRKRKKIQISSALAAYFNMTPNEAIAFIEKKYLAQRDRP
jgi:hypothetical protein